MQQIVQNLVDAPGNITETSNNNPKINFQSNVIHFIMHLTLTPRFVIFCLFLCYLCLLLFWNYAFYITSSFLFALATAIILPYLFFPKHSNSYRLKHPTLKIFNVFFFFISDKISQTPPRAI